MAQHERTCQVSRSKQRVIMQVDGEYVCKMHGDHIRYTDSCEIRLHLFFFHRHQPAEYLASHGYNKELIADTTSWVKPSHVKYQDHRSAYFDHIALTDVTLNIGEYFRLMNPALEAKYYSQVKAEDIVDDNSPRYALLRFLAECAQKEDQVA